MYIASYVQNTTYPTCTKHHMHTTPHIHHAQCTICIKHSIRTVFTQHCICNSHTTLYVPPCTYSDCINNMCTHYIYKILHAHNTIDETYTTILPHIQTTLSLPRNLASSVLSMLILACYRTHFFHFVDVSLELPTHRMDIIS